MTEARPETNWPEAGCAQEMLLQSDRILYLGKCGAKTQVLGLIHFSEYHACSEIWWWWHHACMVQEILLQLCSKNNQKPGRNLTFQWDKAKDSGTFHGPKYKAKVTTRVGKIKWRSKPDWEAVSLCLKILSHLGSVISKSSHGNRTAF